MVATSQSPKTPKKTTAASKTTAVKTTRKSATAKKPAAKAKEEILSPLILLKIWLNGWKKAFVLRGRSSRFETWIFIVVNSVLVSLLQPKLSYLLSPRFLRYAKTQNYSMDTIDNYVFGAEIGLYLIFFIPLIPLISMLIRRIHDLNLVAWRNHLEPAIMGIIVVWMMFLGIDAVQKSNYTYPWLIILMLTCLITSLYGAAYYIIKFLIQTLFYAGSSEPNRYGASKYNTPAHEECALKLSCFFFLYVITLAILYSVAGSL